jgi:hypothetical protein
MSTQAEQRKGWMDGITRPGEILFEQQEILLFAISMF